MEQVGFLYIAWWTPVCVPVSPIHVAEMCEKLSLANGLLVV